MVIFCIYFSTITYAETIVLKSGKTIEGKIIEKTDEYIKIDFFGVALTYYLSDIESIDGKILTESSLYKSDTTTSNLTETFRNEKWGYSFKYPSHWEEIPKEEREPSAAMGVRPIGQDGISIQIYRGECDENTLNNYKTPCDLIEKFLALPSGQTREFKKQVMIANRTGCLVRFLQKKAIVGVKDKTENPIVLPVNYYYDYYFFSPVFSSGGRDKRFFIIILSHMEYMLDNPLATQSNYFIEINKKLKELYEEAEQIVNSFRLTDR